MDDKIKGEYFLRQAFGFALHNGEWVDRHGDPAGLAEAAVFGSASACAKAAIIYAAEIYHAKLGEMDSEEDYKFMQNFPNAIFNAKTSEDLISQIDLFRQTIINKYFEIDDGKVLVKK